MLEWPATLPAPTPDASVDVYSSVLRSEQQQRQRFTYDLHLYRVAWVFTNAQYETFLDFVESLGGGVNWFLLPLPSPGNGVQTITARILDGRYAASHVGVMHWNVSATVEVRQPAIFDPELYALLAETGDPSILEMLGNSLHVAVHETIPNDF